MSIRTNTRTNAGGMKHPKIVISGHEVGRCKAAYTHVVRGNQFNSEPVVAG